jgi:phosphatidylglycerol:prolipoprotein diacylglycerol transferase
MIDSFKVGPLTIHFYGIIIMLGALAAAFLAKKLADLKGEDGEQIWDMLPWLLFAGIVGARLWHIFTPTASLVAQGITFQYYLTHPIDAISTWNGGLGIPGAVIGGIIALLIYARKKKISFLRWTDIIVPGLALAQAIGRWGNYVNQEVYGAPSTLPWAIYIDPAHRLPGFENVATYHPLFLYESLWNLLVAAVLIVLFLRFENKLRNGDILLTYLVAYPTMRFFLEYLRLDTSPVAGINFNQTFMAVIAVAALAVLIFRHTRPEEPESAPEEDPKVEETPGEE